MIEMVKCEEIQSGKVIENINIPETSISLSLNVYNRTTENPSHQKYFLLKPILPNNEKIEYFYPLAKRMMPCKLHGSNEIEAQLIIG